MKTTGTKEEILTVFSVVKDDQTNKISMEVFGRLLGDLERVGVFVKILALMAYELLAFIRAFFPA